MVEVVARLERADRYDALLREGVTMGCTSSIPCIIFDCGSVKPHVCIRGLHVVIQCPHLIYGKVSQAEAIHGSVSLTTVECHLALGDAGDGEAKWPGKV
jgi:hypothetical protein